MFFWIMAPSYSGSWLPIFWRDLGHRFYPEVRGTWQHIPEHIALCCEGSVSFTWHHIPEGLHLEGTLSFASTMKMETAGSWILVIPRKTRWWYNLVDHNPNQVWCLDSSVIWKVLDKYLVSHDFVLQPCKDRGICKIAVWCLCYVINITCRSIEVHAMDSILSNGCMISHFVLQIPMKAN